jgi:hypothetical protein
MSVFTQIRWLDWCHQYGYDAAGGADPAGLEPSRDCAPWGSLLQRHVTATADQKSGPRIRVGTAVGVDGSRSGRGVGLGCRDDVVEIG